MPTPWAKCYDNKDEYNTVGAYYTGQEQQWSIPAGRDIRRLLAHRRAWFNEPDMINRQILLRIMQEFEEDPLLRQWRKLSECF